MTEEMPNAVVYSLAKGKLYKHGVARLKPYASKEDEPGYPLALACYKKPHRNQFAVVSDRPGVVRVRSKSNATVWYEADGPDLDDVARRALSEGVRCYADDEYAASVSAAENRRKSSYELAEDILGTRVLAMTKKARTL